MKCISTKLGLWFRFGRWEDSYWQFLWWASDVHSPKPNFCVSHRLPWKGIQVRVYCHRPSLKNGSCILLDGHQNQSSSDPWVYSNSFLCYQPLKPDYKQTTHCKPSSTAVETAEVPQLGAEGEWWKRDLSSGDTITDYIWKLQCGSLAMGMCPLRTENEADWWILKDIL